MDKDRVLKHIEMDMNGIVFNEEQRESAATMAHTYVTIYATACKDSGSYDIARQAAQDIMVAMFKANQ